MKKISWQNFTGKSVPLIFVAREDGMCGSKNTPQKEDKSYNIDGFFIECQKLHLVLDVLNKCKEDNKTRFKKIIYGMTGPACPRVLPKPLLILKLGCIDGRKASFL